MQYHCEHCAENYENVRTKVCTRLVNLDNNLTTKETRELSRGIVNERVMILNSQMPYRSLDSIDLY